MYCFIDLCGASKLRDPLAIVVKLCCCISSRWYVIPEAVLAVVYDVLRHRIGITYEAEAENVTSEDIISKIVNVIEVP